jgi:hypothetical protein
LGVGISKRLDKWVHSGSLGLGSDDSQASFEVQFAGDPGPTKIDADQYSRTYVTLGYGATYLYDQKTAFYGALQIQNSSYDQEDIDFPVYIGSGDPTAVATHSDADYDYFKRDGNKIDLSVGVTHQWNRSLHFRGQLSATDVSSDLEVYEYSTERLEVGAGYQL